MNFVGEMRAFGVWLKAYHLPSLAQLLWFKLMLRNNECMWSEWFVVNNQDLAVLMGVESEKTAISARDKLIENGLLEYRKGKKGCPNKYRMISIYSNFYSVSGSVSYRENSSINAGNPTVQGADIYKQEEIKTSFCVDDDARGREEETEVTPEYLFSQYFGGAPTPAEREHCTRWLVKHGAELVEQAFNTACMAGQKNLAYVRGIFNRYEARDIHDLGDVAADDLRHRAAR